MKTKKFFRDGLYTANLCWCGYETKQYMINWCDSWLDVAPTYEEARTIIANHKKERVNKLLTNCFFNGDNPTDSLKVRL